MSRYGIIIELIDKHIEKYQKALDEVDSESSNHWCNTIINDMRKLQSEIKLLELVRKSNDPSKMLEEIREIHLNGDEYDRVKELLDDS